MIVIENLHVHDHVDMEGINQKLDTILRKLRRIEGEVKTMAQDLTALTSQVQANTDAEQSAVVLIAGLAVQIEALKADPVALQALADQLKASQVALAAAVVANTQVAVAPPVPPVQVPPVAPTTI